MLSTDAIFTTLLIMGTFYITNTCVLLLLLMPFKCFTMDIITFYHIGADILLGRMEVGEQTFDIK